MEIAEKIWALVSEWDYFSRVTSGKQLVGTADSISANLGEGFGRYHYRENKKFGYYSRGSLYKTKTWLVRPITA